MHYQTQKKVLARVIQMHKGNWHARARSLASFEPIFSWTEAGREIITLRDLKFRVIWLVQSLIFDTVHEIVLCVMVFGRMAFYEVLAPDMTERGVGNWECTFPEIENLRAHARWVLECTSQKLKSWERQPRPQSEYQTCTPWSTCWAQWAVIQHFF